VWAVNKTGDDLRMGDVGAVDLSGATPFADNPMKVVSAGMAITLREPTDADAGNWVVAAQKIPNNQGGWVYESGVVLARVQDGGSENGLPFVEIDPDGTPATLIQASAGSGIILGDLLGETTAGGEQWALIRFPWVMAIPLYQATAAEAEGEITAKAVNQDGSLADTEYTFTTLSEGS